MNLTEIDLTTLSGRYGFSMVGVTNAKQYPEEQEKYSQWIFHGYHGSMSYLERHREAKFNPQKLLAGAQSVVVVGLSYYQSAGALPEGCGKIARFAWGRDYHKILGGKLKNFERDLRARYPGEEFRAFVDATPLSERYYAYQAGLGFIGQNNLLIHPVYGSFFVLGEILTTLRYEGKAPPPMPSLCGNCTRCLEICPTQALRQPCEIDARRCLAYLTIENKDEIPEEFHDKMANCLLGCDLCQEVCPYNQNLPTTPEPDFLKHRLGPSQNLEGILKLVTDEEFRQKYAGTAALRVGWKAFLRNAEILKKRQ